MHFLLVYGLVMMKPIDDVVRVELCTYFPRLWHQDSWVLLLKQGGFTRELSPHYFQPMYSMLGHILIYDHNITYPIDEPLAEPSVPAIGETENKILFLVLDRKKNCHT